MGLRFVRTLAVCFLLSLEVLCGSAGAQLVETGIPVVVDGNGQTVGPVVSFGTNPIDLDYADTALFLDGAPYFLQLFAGTNDSVLWQPGRAFIVAFEDASCLGTPYLVDLGNGLGAAFSDVAIVNDPGLTLWRPIGGASPQPLNLTHFLLLENGSCSLISGGPLLEGVAAERVPTEFVPPYSIQLSAATLGVLDVPAVSAGGLVLLALLLGAGGYFALRTTS